MNRERTEFLVVHSSATPPRQAIGAQEIRTWHIERGWDDIGYHYVIRRDGTVEVGRPLNSVGAHAKGINSKSVGVCLVGGVNSGGEPANNFTDAQRIALFQVLLGLRAKFPGAQVIGHRDAPSAETECPSFNVREWWSAVTNFPEVAELQADIDKIAVCVEQGYSEEALGFLSELREKLGGCG